MKTSIRAAIPLARCAAGATAGAAPSQCAAAAIASGNGCTPTGQEIPEHASL